MLGALIDLIRGGEALDQAVQQIVRSARILAHPAPPCGRCDQYHAGQICPRALSICPYCGFRGHIEIECQRKLGDELIMGNAETEENEAPEGGQAQSAVDPVGDAP